MAEVKLHILDREYAVTCGDGEEARLGELGQMIDDKARAARLDAGGLTESRQLLFAALLLADEAKDAGANPAVAKVPADALLSEQIADRLEKIAEKLEQLSSRA